MADFFEGRVITKVFNGTNSFRLPPGRCDSYRKRSVEVCAATCAHTYDHMLSGALVTP